ncbi:2-succinyl-5-enolpyruvyl-6-hydroxy-3-cyclohexene-1-carboxylic-acid synthase [Dechloromonas sp. XY25]|uniref:2-succinyl-5-enolpyruvyl-6-hydroxy-3-cyclohexene-1-carboxylate synthase n=1 Tax=Dechloromonas hankyongensis TaxID=2908002 RepID=A0ABS9K3H5_9RHOO|nr:2-succinyl-5-enolpyruvyl-6-hydroxy-3-cyclohexene-1-carboxylic-acid synthase [Dechloromonas hankyongensis]MCG2577695.1 2-succinyl-5-enolpyruvyl-6-hydroxy-3-cyclohexene-1-carboxylic-acid synthase [Dechloromonas hankyongensis]
MTDTGSLNLQWSQAMIAGFVAAGITDAVISPGSRSTPLALAMLRQPRLRCHVAIDERSAAFFGLGIAKAQRRPALLLATSGTAPANWLPAIIEASHSGVPLIAISADRPPELQACGANQTVNQSAMFAPHMRASHALGAPHPGFDPGYLHRLAAQIHEQASWPYPGPVHINQPFREPLLPVAPAVGDDIPARLQAAHARPQPDAQQIAELAKHLSGRPGVMVCGEMPANPGQNAALAELASRLACPILAEPLSGLRFGPHDRSHVCVGYNRWLDAGAAHAFLKPEWILRFGAFPATRNLQNYVSGNAAMHIVVDPWPRWIDPSRQITHLLRADPTAFCQDLLRKKLEPAADGWLAAFSAQEKRAMQDREPDHIAAVLDALPAETALFIGNSLAIRQLDSLSGHADKTLHLYANRGASGIDGNISTAAGIASAKGRTVALIGDLTCQHDIGGLALTRGLDIVIVTVNNGGGGIFDYLPQHSLPEFIKGWRTPQEVDFEHAALAFGLSYQCAQSTSGLHSALGHALSSGGAHLIELKQL